MFSSGSVCSLLTWGGETTNASDGRFSGKVGLTHAPDQGAHSSPLCVANASLLSLM